MNYLLDTNIVLIYSRESTLTERLENKHQLFNGNNDLYISIVTVGELESIALQRNYGKKKIEKLHHILSNFTVVDINIQEIIEQYAKIDAYSQGKLKDKPSGFSSRNMGKNDLWIAATSSVYDLILITPDQDFNHLDREYLQLNYVDLNEL
ncbi:MAG: type II toxin-antitoxin system VapC family toxin [Bacteroidota bacterium]